MALKQNPAKAATAPGAPVEPPPEDTMVLELALYKNYMMGRVVYEKGSVYRFRKEDALRLLGENDLGRPIWKIHRPVVKKMAPENVVRVATAIKVAPPGEPIHGLPVEGGKKTRIEIGDDDEIADILGREDNDDEKQTPDPGDVIV